MRRRDGGGQWYGGVALSKDRHIMEWTWECFGRRWSVVVVVVEERRADTRT